MREPVTRERIERFFAELGRRVRGPARVIVAGGASLVLRGLRPKTQDIDIDYTVAPGGDGAFISALRDLKDELSVDVELASPGHFIPLPSGREGRLTFHERYGAADVFLEDVYSVALSKLERGQAKDLNDVRILAEAGLVTWPELEAKAREIASPERGKEAARVDLDRMLARLERVRQTRPS